MGSISLSSNSPSFPFFILQWNEFCDLISGGPWDQACSKWSFEDLSEDRRLALPHLARRFSESRQFLMTDTPTVVNPLEVIWLKLRLFAGLCSQLAEFYREHHRPHLGLGPSRLGVMFPKAPNPLLPARWDFLVRTLNPEEAAIPFSHETMPPAFQANLYQPPHSLDSVFKAPELREWPLGTSKEFTALLRSMEKIRPQEVVPTQVRGIFQIHLLSDNLQEAFFSSQDVFCVQLPLPQQGHSGPNIWMARVESPERGIILRGQSELMPVSSWEQIEVGKDSAFAKTPVKVFRSFSNSCDAYSLGLLLFQVLLGRDPETMNRLENCLPIMVKRHKSICKSHVDQSGERGVDPRWLLFEEQGTLFKPGRLLSADTTTVSDHQALPEYIWYAVLELALALIAREELGWSSMDSEASEPLDPVSRMEGLISRIQTIGEWIRLELFSPQQRRGEILSACQKVRMEIG